MRPILVERDSGQERRAAAQSTRRRWSSDEANVGLREDVVVIIRKVQTPHGLWWSNRRGKSIAAIVLEVADIGGCVPVFQDIDSEAEIQPIFWLVCAAQLILL